MSIQVSLNHIGIATESGSSSLDKLFRILGIQKGITEAVPEQGVQVHFYELQGSPPHLELLEVEDPKGSVARFLEKRGPGIHHLSFLVESGGLDRLCGQLQAEGYRFTYDSPRIGAQNMRINFIHPASAGGVLIELMEAAGAAENH